MPQTAVVLDIPEEAYPASTLSGAFVDLNDADCLFWRQESRFHKGGALVKLFGLLYWKTLARAGGKPRGRHIQGTWGQVQPTEDGGEVKGIICGALHHLL